MKNTPHAQAPFPIKRRQLLAAAGAVGASLWLPAHAQTAKLPRLVTLGGAITEVVYALGAEGQLVGTDTTSLFPPAALNTPKVGYMRSLSAEGLLSLKPDAVIGTTEAGPVVVLDQLRSAGVRVDLIEADHSWAEVQRKIQAVGRSAAREPQAKALQAKLDADWAVVQKEVADAVKSRGRKPKVLFILAHGASPQVAGGKTAADAMINFAGGINVMTGFNGYRAMTAEAMAAAAPDFVLTSTQGIEAQGGLEKFWARPELALTPAFKKRALVQLDALELIGFGPRLPQTVRTLCQQLVLA
ncbi:heme/hemin ABC transporter substrate-binding protein [Variovorax sp. HJSM1_2]|uniref:heme/hemin ABC transporter substrate-binding protein n=1 Tax=Variovorax sp. HJSM1_2 TaxID=3366263 RepID=UPI003BBEB57A